MVMVLLGSGVGVLLTGFKKSWIGALLEQTSLRCSVRPEKFQFLKKWQNRNFDQKSEIYSLDLG